MRSLLACAAVLAAALAACSSAPAGDDVASSPDDARPSTGAAAPGAAADPAPPSPAGDAPPAECAITVTDAAASPLATAAEPGEHALTIEAASASRTSWGEAGNEAVVLEVLRGDELVGHVVMHQGVAVFPYAMHTGALAAGDALSVRVSPLTAPKAQKRACITGVKLVPASALGALAEGVAHAPVLKWPTEKTFDDLPVLLGWSKAGKSYQLTYTNEDGGTVALCGGGARGMRSEIARWGRGVDIEGVWAYGGAGRFERCTGVVPPSPGAPRMQDDHPILYYGDGHNRVFESRGGYGQACGTGADKTPNGDLKGWNALNPGDELAKDGPFTIVLRPLPVDLDALGVKDYGGRREGMVDTYAPWLYRITDAELVREGKVDDKNTFGMSRYLYVDVYAADVGGSGDATCGPVPFAPDLSAHVSGGFKLRAIAKSGAVSDGPQMTVDYFGGGGSGVKRVAVPLAAGVGAADITKIVFDAYDGDGIYLLGLGDAFVPEPAGDNGATLAYVHKGKKALAAYVDDDASGCTNGMSTRGGVAYPCVWSSIEITP